MVLSIEAFEFQRDSCGLNLVKNLHKEHGTLTELWKLERWFGQKPKRMGFWRPGKLHLSREMNTSMVCIGDKKTRKQEDGWARYSWIRGTLWEEQGVERDYIVIMVVTSDCIVFGTINVIGKRLVQGKIMPRKADRVLTLWHAWWCTIIKTSTSLLPSPFYRGEKPRLREEVTGPQLYTFIT